MQPWRNLNLKDVCRNIRRSHHLHDCYALRSTIMSLTGVRFIAAALIGGQILVGCGGGGSSPSQQSATPTPIPTPTPTPTISGTPGPITASWRGDGAFSAQSDPNWLLSFTPAIGDPASSITNGPPIIFTSVGQSVTITFNQANFNGLLPKLAIFNGCSGIDGKPIANRKYSVVYSAISSSNCYAQFQGDAPGYYPGDAISFPILVPAGR